MFLHKLIWRSCNANMGFLIEGHRGLISIKEGRVEWNDTIFRFLFFFFFFFLYWNFDVDR